MFAAICAEYVGWGGKEVAWASVVHMGHCVVALCGGIVWWHWEHRPQSNPAPLTGVGTRVLTRTKNHATRMGRMRSEEHIHA